MVEVVSGGDECLWKEKVKRGRRRIFGRDKWIERGEEKEVWLALL